MLAAAALALAVAAAPEFRAEGGLEPGTAAAAARTWEELERILLADGLAALGASRPIRIAPGPALPPGVSGASRPGEIALRPGLGAGDAALALRHEVAHQLLFHACPAASDDRLFHEAFALAATGELAAWAPGSGAEYRSLAHALQNLSRTRALDGPAARGALARLLLDAPARPGRLPAAIARPLSRCEAGATWVPLRPEDLAEGGAPAADALVVLSRHSGEVLRAEGATTLPLPFGSTLKPFVLASARRPPPRLAPVPGRPEWSCGGGLPARMDAGTALLRSCNGWFLALAAAEPEVVHMGRWGEALVALGLSGLPADAGEAIGLRPSLRIPAIGLAHAYRLLAESRPDLVDVLSRNAREGTLSGLRSSGSLAGVAVKTGSVFDAKGRPRLGWIAAVDEDVVLVMARAGRTPRSFADQAAAALAAARTPAGGAARVQVLGLVATGEVTASCEGRGFVAEREGPRPVGGEVALLAAARSGPVLCAGGPW
ncbi:MAG TPA: hypothetical protein VLS93_10870, partial [Anaeromyxobacteraceae bacterium]|nr:hypothetical protein [Anaeromyxobacteraceae bacterium]